MMLQQTEATKEFLRPPEIKPGDALFVDVQEYGNQTFFIGDIMTVDPKYVRNTSHQFARRPEKSILRETHVKNECQVFETMAGNWIKLDPRGWASYDATYFLQRFPENWKHGGWQGLSRRLGLTDFSAALINVWPENRLVMTEAAKEWYFLFLARLGIQSQRAEAQAEFKLQGSLPVAFEKDPILQKYTDKKDLPLSDYQKAATYLGLQQPYCLHMEQGTGKTPIGQAIVNVSAVKKRQEDPNSLYRVVIVCPKQVRYNWQCEIKKFATVSGAVTRINGNKIERFSQLVKATAPDSPLLKGALFSAVIVSYDTFANDIALYTQFGETLGWDLVIYDESHYYKNHDTKRFKAIKKFRDTAKQTLALTGTPVTNSLLDLFSQLESLGEGFSGFQTWKGFKDFHVRYEDVGQVATGGHFQKILGFENVPLLQERLSRLAFRITKQEAGLNLPDKVYDLHEVEMTKKQEKVYKDLADSLFAELDAKLEHSNEPIEVTIQNVLTKLLRLAQVTSGHIKGDDMDKPVQIDKTNPKVDAVLDLLNAPTKSPLEKTLIWAVFVQDIEVLSEALKKEGIGHVTYYGATSEKNRQAAVDAFNNDPYCKVFIGHPRAAGAGLNLLGYDKEAPETCTIPGMRPAIGIDSNGVSECEHTYTGHEIFFSNNWSMTDRAQAEDRAHRRGTVMPVRITDIIVPGSIDTEIIARVQGKRENAETIQDIRSILKSIQGLEE